MLRKITILILAFFLILPVYAGEKEAEKSEAKIRTYNVEGMYCAMCPIKIKSAVSGLDGVQACEVDFEKNSMTLTYSDGADLGSVSEAVEELGYTASPLDDETAPVPATKKDSDKEEPLEE